MKKLLITIILFVFTKISYGQDFSRTFYPSQLKEEIAVLKEALITLHPGLYKFNSKQQVEKLFADLNKQASKPLKEKEFYLLLAKFTEKIGCGHTYLNPLNLEESIPALYMPRRVIPLCFTIIDKKIIITHNLSNNASLIKGTEITKINGIPTSQIIDSLLQVSRADGKNANGKKLTNIAITPEQVGDYNLIDIFLPLFFKNIGIDFVIDAKSIDNKVFNTKINGVTTLQRSNIYKRDFGLIPRGANSLKVAMLNDSTSYFKVGTFSFYGEKNPFTKIADSLFASLSNNKNVKNLIIDIRTNEGGNSDIRNALLKYVLPKNFVAKEYQERPFYSSLTVPSNLTPFLHAWDSRFFEAKPDSIFKKNELGFYEDQTVNSKISKNFEDFKIYDNSFKGNIYLLTSPVNSSAAFEFSWIFSQYKAGVIVGEKTGGTKQGLNSGRFFYLRLPYSRIEIDLPFIYQAHIGQPDEGVTPNFTVKTTQQDVAKGADTQINYVLDLISGKIKKN